MWFADLNPTWFTLMGYPLTGLEVIGSLSGLIAVFLAARSNIWTWPVGIVNVSCFFFVFYSVQLYSDMFLQLFYLFISIDGWIKWNKKGTDSLQHAWLKRNQQYQLPLLILLSTLALGFFISRLHVLFPTYFGKPADFAYIDSLIAVMSIIATVLQARKKIDSWVIWIIVDLICTVVYWIKDIRLIAVEFFIFVLIACYGLYQWIRMERSSRQNTVERNSLQ